MQAQKGVSTEIVQGRLIWL